MGVTEASFKVHDVANSVLRQRSDVPKLMQQPKE